MKQTRAIALAIAIILCLSLGTGCSSQEVKKNPYRIASVRTELYRNGSVSSVYTSDYTYDSFGLSQILSYEDGVLTVSSYYTCDENGLILASKAVRADGSESSIAYNMTLDQAGRPVYREEYRDGQLEAVWEYSYDEDGHVTTEKSTRYENGQQSGTVHVLSDYDRRGNIVRKMTRPSHGSGTDVLYLYSSGRLTREETYTESGDLHSYIAYTYDETGLVVTRSYCDSDDTLLNRTVTTYDEYGNTLSVVAYMGDDGQPERTVTYTYERKNGQ